MVPGSKEEEYLNGRWQSQRDYYSKRSKQYKRWHQSLLIISSIGAVLVPIIITIPATPKSIEIATSALASIALVLDNVLHFKDNWKKFRQTVEALKRERIFFENRIGSYASPQTALSLFIRKCEDIMKTEGKGYFDRDGASDYQAQK